LGNTSNGCEGDGLALLLERPYRLKHLLSLLLFTLLLRLAERFSLLLTVDFSH
jgi:hypothetical protein